jgi:hypothetical protein
MSILLIAQRAPAPIVEPEATPSVTPAVKQSEVPKRKHHPTRSTTAEQSSSPQSEAKPTPRLTPSVTRSRLAGTWVGVMPTFPWGDITETFTINEHLTEVTLVTSREQFLKAVHIRIEGDKLIADFGGLYGIYTLTPSADGITVSVRLQAIMNDHTATYRRK